MATDTPDTAKAIELLRQHEAAGTWVERKTQSALVEVAAAAVAVQDAEAAMDICVDAETSADHAVAMNNLDTAIANLTRGVLNNG